MADVRRIVLSRKGFDSAYGGYPSPVLPGGRMLSLPIPSGDVLRYSDLRFDERTSYYDLMFQLRPKVRHRKEWHPLTPSTRCHLDPDLSRETIRRDPSWLPLFGQIGGAQTHLENRGVGAGDLFLFFGTFREAEFTAGGLKFKRGAPAVHAVFGYIQVGEVVRVGPDTRCPAWMRYHPHVDSGRKHETNNTIWVAREKFSLDPDLPGGGTLAFGEGLVLSKRGESKSKWSLPPVFEGAEISHHGPGAWRDGYFQSASIGQEFVVDATPEIVDWAVNLVSGHARATPLFTR
ncbi:MAG: hypothetical protein ACTSU5_13575 [Promethearchaeota archaeon]